MEDQRIKVYVAVTAEHQPDGSCRPRQIRFADSGKAYEIDKIISACRAASRKVGGTGIRYTVRIRSQETFLFDEENGKWFVELKAGTQPG